MNTIYLLKFVTYVSDVKLDDKLSIVTIRQAIKTRIIEIKHIF